MNTAVTKPKGGNSYLSEEGEQFQIWNEEQVRTFVLELRRQFLTLVQFNTLKHEEVVDIEKVKRNLWKAKTADGREEALLSFDPYYPVWIKESFRFVDGKIEYFASRDPHAPVGLVKWERARSMKKEQSRIQVGLAGIRAFRIQHLTTTDILEEGHRAANPEALRHVFIQSWNGSNRTLYHTNPWVFVHTLS